MRVINHLALSTKLVIRLDVHYLLTFINERNTLYWSHLYIQFMKRHVQSDLRSRRLEWENSVLKLVP